MSSFLSVISVVMETCFIKVSIMLVIKTLIIDFEIADFLNVVWGHTTTLAFFFFFLQKACCCSSSSIVSLVLRTPKLLGAPPRWEFLQQEPVMTWIWRLRRRTNWGPEVLHLSCVLCICSAFRTVSLNLVVCSSSQVWLDWRTSAIPATWTQLSRRFPTGKNPNNEFSFSLVVLWFNQSLSFWFIF